jgi:7-cyano-7-deazaguanine synthase
MNPVIVLFSGGVDSTVLATEALNQNRLHSLLHLSYMQPAAPYEFRVASEWARKNKAELVRVMPTLYGTDAMNAESGKPGPRVIPGRNLIMLSLAINYAASVGVKEVWYGPTRDDWEDYPDCRPEFVEQLCNLANEDVGVKVIAPLLQLTKKEVMARAIELGVNIDETWSCYAPDPMTGEPCGSCNSCKLREEAINGTGL